MTQPSRWGFARFARVAAAGLAVVLFSAGRLAAQSTTGKIEGLVREPSGAPIGGAQIRIVGSAYAATTNEQGYYFINNVPAGVKVIRGQYIGYAPAEVRNVRVLPDQTMTVNLTLEQRAVEVTGITITVQQNPIVPRDQVTSRSIYQGEALEHLPIDNVNSLVAVQPGVVQGDRGLTIRGGRPGEAAIYIDGVLVRNFNSTFGGSSTPSLGTATVGTNALEEASVTTGAIGAEFGEAQSGVISFVTRAGGTSYHGTVHYATDELSGQTYGAGLHRLETSFSGPVMRNLTFFVGTTMMGQQNDLRSKGSNEVPIYVLDGVDTTVTAPLTPGSATSDSTVVAIPRFARYSDGSRRPDDNSDNWNLDAKLQYTYGAGSRISATFHRTRAQNLNFRGTNLYNPVAQTGGRTLSHVVVLGWTQSLLTSSSRALSLDAALSYQRDQTVRGQVDPTWVEQHRDPFAWFNFSNMQFVSDLESFPIDETLVRNIRTNNCANPRDIGGGQTAGACIPFLLRTDLNAVGPYRANPYGISEGSAYFPSANPGNLAVLLNTESRWTGRATLDWQANRYNRVRMGGDFTTADMKGFQSGMISQFGLDAYILSPSKVALFAQDRLDLGDVVVELGVRWDRMNSGVMYPNNPARTFTDPARTGSLSGAFTAADTAAATACSIAMAAADSTAWSTCNFFTAAARSRVSPTLRVSFPVTDRTGFRLSYSQQVQTPDFGQLATCSNCDLSFTNTNDIFGRDLDFGKSILFEFGVRHAFSEDMVLDISAYNKDKVSDITARVTPVLDPLRGTVTNMNLMTNADFGNVRGVDVSLNRRFGQIFHGSLVYTYQSARGTGSDPFEYILGTSRQISSVTGDRNPPPQALLTTKDNRTHTIAGSMAFSFPHGWRSGTMAGTLMQDMGIFTTFRFASGLAYTRLANDGAGVTGPGNTFGLAGTALEQVNGSTMPWIKDVSLRVTRGFRMGGSRDVTVFADFRNLFNFTNLTRIFAETGDIANAKHRERQIAPVRQLLQTDAGALYYNRDVTRDGVTQSLAGVELNCSVYPYGSGGSGGVPDCLLLRQTEQRFGDGDGFFDSVEQERAFNAWYDLFNGKQTFRAPGFNVRVGFELNF
jgi:hypothetical protein